MADRAEAPSTETKRRFTLPSAYTILFALIVLMAIATWLIPAGRVQARQGRSPIPGTYHEVDAHPQRILVDSLTAPINGLYGIENAKGNINYYNSGILFGAIDVALFIIVIGGFLGVTMRPAPSRTASAAWSQRLRGRERWMIPILMSVFALGGTTYGMAEESLAFYALVIAVMIAAGYDALTGAAVVLLGCGIGTTGRRSTRSRRHRVRLRRGLHQRRILAPPRDPDRRSRDRHLLRACGTPTGSRADPTQSVVADMREDNEARFSAGATATRTPC